MHRFARLALGAAAFLAALACAAPASADTVVLKNGNKLEGKVSYVEDEVVLKTRLGETRFKKSNVVKVTKGPTRYDTYLAKKKAVEKDDVKGHLALGDWCRKQGFKSDARRHWKAVLAVDPNHKDARARLGFIRYDGAWLTKAEYFEARDYVKVKGKWIPREEARRQAARKEVEDAGRKKLRTIKSAVRKMSSRRRAVRKAGRLALKKYAKGLGDERLAAWADEVATYYNDQWRIVKERLVAQALTEVRATHSELKRPIKELSTSLGAFSTPVRIQLPELSVVSVKTTVLIPADIELDDE